MSCDTVLLFSSDADMIALGAAVEKRYVSVFVDHFRIRSYSLVLPGFLSVDLRLFKTMRHRHRRGDFRHTDDENLSTRRIADWTLIVNCDIRNQTFVPIDWV